MNVCSLSHSHGTLEENEAIINVFSYTRTGPTAASQTIFCLKGLLKTVGQNSGGLRQDPQVDHDFLA